MSSTTADCPSAAHVPEPTAREHANGLNPLIDSAGPLDTLENCQALLLYLAAHSVTDGNSLTTDEEHGQWVLLRTMAAALRFEVGQVADRPELEDETVTGRIRRLAARKAG